LILQLYFIPACGTYFYYGCDRRLLFLLFSFSSPRFISFLFSPLIFTNPPLETPHQFGFDGIPRPLFCWCWSSSFLDVKSPFPPGLNPLFRFSLPVTFQYPLERYGRLGHSPNHSESPPPLLVFTHNPLSTLFPPPSFLLTSCLFLRPPAPKTGFP